MPITYWNHVIKMTGVLLSGFYIFIKAINHKSIGIHKIYSVLWCFMWALLYAANMLWRPFLMFEPIIYVAFIVFFQMVLKLRIDTVISAYLLSYGISYSFYSIASLPIGLIIVPFLSTEYNINLFIDLNKPIFLLYYTVVALLQFIMAYGLFKIKRFKNGFPFLFEKYAVVLALIVGGTVLAIVSLLSAPREQYENDFFAFMPLVAGIIVVGIGIIIWIRRGIKSAYKKKMLERNIELLEQELDEIKAKSQRLIEQNKYLQATTSNRLKELERIVTTGSDNTAHILLEGIKVLSQDFQRVRYKPLPPTKVGIIDKLFEYFLEKFVEKNIDFNLSVNGSIPYLIENVIEQSKLETMIGDHLQDALIAVDVSDNSFRSVLAIIGLTEECYEFTVFDSGIPFETDTLVRLGTDYITTHIGSSGSGIGFMTTFKTMKECGASLIIREKKPSGTNYTKSITIRFDGREQYIIETYRPSDIPPDKNGRYQVADRR